MESTILVYFYLSRKERNYNDLPTISVPSIRSVLFTHGHGWSEIRRLECGTGEKAAGRKLDKQPFYPTQFERPCDDSMFLNKTRIPMRLKVRENKVFAFQIKHFLQVFFYLPLHRHVNENKLCTITF